MKYSVIIPVYKAEKTIRRCVESLLNQPHEDTEIIIVNDGSPDNCGEICKEYAAQNHCIKYFEKENGGVSSARNIGLEKAYGDYVLFVDSDDYVNPNYFKRISVGLAENQPDMLLFGGEYVGNGKRVWDTGNYVVDGEMKIAKKTEEAIKAYLFSNLMTKTFDRKIIQKHKLRFDESLSIGEDQVFVFQYAMHVKRMASISDVLYNFIGENTESLSRKRRDYLSEQLLKVNLEMLSSLSDAECSEQVRKIYFESIVWTHYRSAYSACKELLKFKMTNIERRQRIKQICEMYTIKEFKPTKLRSWVIAFPILYRMCYVIDLLAIRSYKQRQTDH